MMMTQQYYGGDYDPSYRSNPRAMPMQTYANRHLPYQPFQGRHELRSDSNAGLGTLIHDSEADTAGGQARRRIAVACSRCRRRKIKCSGDPGDGTGCQACRQAGQDANACNFIRVGSTALSSVIGLDITPHTSTVAFPSSYGSATAPTNNYSNSSTSYQSHPRQSIPTLQTRAPNPQTFGSQFDDSPIDAYTYASTSAGFPERQPYAGSYASQDNLQSWSSAAHSAPVTTSYFEAMPTYSFGGLQTTYPPSSTSRYAAATTDAFSSLNMTSLTSSLPTPHERRLPVPYTPQYHGSYPNIEVPDIRPITAPHINGVHSRTAMPWSTDSTISDSHQNSISGVPSLNTMPPPAPQSSTSSSSSEPGVMGYQIGAGGLLQRTEGPGLSPTTGPGMMSSFHMPALSTNSLSSSLHTTSFRYAPTSSTNTVLPSIMAEERPVSRQEPPANMYSFSSDSTDRPSSSTNHSSESTLITSPSYPPLRQPQPQHVASAEALRRQSSFDQHPNRSTSHRASSSNLNGRY